MVICAFPVGCSETAYFHVRLSEIQSAEQRNFTTSNPSEKNRMLRQAGTSLIGTLPGFNLPYPLVSGLEKRTTAGLTVYSRDEGITFKRPDIHDSAPAAIRREDSLHLFWSGGGLGSDHIFHATSQDGWLWTAPRAVLGPSAPSEPSPADATHTTDPAVVYLNDTYFLYYTATDNGTIDNEIFLATSKDCVKWVKYSDSGNPNRPTPVIANESPDGTFGMGKPSVFIEEGVFFLYFTDRRLGTSGLYLATSRDGKIFTQPKLVAEGMDNADVKYCPAHQIYVMVYGELNDDKIYFACSKDPEKWPAHHDGRTLATGLPETIHHSPAILSNGQGHMPARSRVFYSGGVQQETGWHNTWEIESTLLELHAGAVE